MDRCSTIIMLSIIIIMSSRRVNYDKSLKYSILCFYRLNFIQKANSVILHQVHVNNHPCDGGRSIQQETLLTTTLLHWVLILPYSLALSFLLYSALLCSTLLYFEGGGKRRRRKKKTENEGREGQRGLPASLKHPGLSQIQGFRDDYFVNFYLLIPSLELLLPCCQARSPTISFAAFTLAASKPPHLLSATRVPTPFQDVCPQTAVAATVLQSIDWTFFR